MPDAQKENKKEAAKSERGVDKKPASPAFSIVGILPPCLGDAHPKGTSPSGVAFHWDHHQQLCRHPWIGCGRPRHWVGDQSRTDPRERIPREGFRMDQPSGHRHRTEVLDVRLHRFDCSVPVQGAGQFGIESDPDPLFFCHRPPDFGLDVAIPFFTEFGAHAIDGVWARAGRNQWVALEFGQHSSLLGTCVSSTSSWSSRPLPLVW